MDKKEKAKGHITLISKILYINRIFSYFVVAGALIFSVAITLFLTPVPYSDTPAIGLALEALTTSIPVLFLGYGYYVVSNSLYTVINNVGKGASFDKQNQKEIRRIGVTALALSIYLAVFRYVIVPLVSNFVYFYNDSSLPVYQLNPFLLAAFALIMFALAEVFSQGEKLKEEHDLTV